MCVCDIRQVDSLYLGESKKYNFFVIKIGTEKSEVLRPHATQQSLKCSFSSNVNQFSSQNVFNLNLDFNEN
jgi:hypothetical protein